MQGFKGFKTQMARLNRDSASTKNPEDDRIRQIRKRKDAAPVDEPVRQDVRIDDSKNADTSAPDTPEATSDSTEPTGEAVLIEKLSEALKLLSEKDAKESDYQQKIDTLASQLQAAQAAADTAKTEAEQAKADATNTIHSLFRVAGVAPGGAGLQDKKVNFNTLGTSDRIDGATAEFESIMNRADCYQHLTMANNIQVVRDTRELDQFVKQNRASLNSDMEKFARNNGLLRGQNRQVQNADTVKANIPDMFLAYLSSIVRLTHIPSFIWHQFTPIRLDVSRGQGDTIIIPRWAYQPVAAAPNDRLLSGGGNYVRIVNERQALTQTNVPAIIQEFGMGADSDNGQPILMPEFVSAYSLQNLEQIIIRNIGYDYRAWEDLYIRSSYDVTSVVWYNDNQVPTTAPLDVGADDDGRFTTEFLDSAYAEMRALQIPPMDDGCYIGAINTYAADTFKKSFYDSQQKWQAPTADALQEITSMLNLMNGGAMDKVSGYLGKWNNFHLFESNAWGLGNAGTPGAQTETLGSGSVTTRTSYLFGRDAVGRGVGQPMEIRMDEMRDFGRSNSYIWRSEEVVKGVDVDPVGSGEASQQLRVIEVRTVRNAV